MAWGRDSNSVPLRTHLEKMIQNLRVYMDSKFIERSEAAALARDEARRTALELEKTLDEKFMSRDKAVEVGVTNLDKSLNIIRAVQIDQVKDRKDLFTKQEHDAYAKARDDALNNIKDEVARMGKPNWQGLAAVGALALMMMGGIWGLAFNPLNLRQEETVKELRRLEESIAARHETEGVTKRDLQEIHRIQDDNIKLIQQLEKQMIEHEVETRSLAGRGGRPK